MRRSSISADRGYGLRAPRMVEPDAMADRPPRILLADDEQAIQTLLSFPLQKDGYDVVRASDGQEALARFSEQAFDLVVLDVMMPRIDGLEVCRRLRAKQLGADHHAHRQGRGDRQGPRPRARRRRLHHQAVLDARVPLARQGGAAARRDDALERAPRTARSRSTVHELRIDFAKRSVARARRRRPDDLRRVRDPHRAGARTRAGCSRATCCSTRIWGDSAYRDPRTVDVHIRHLREKLELDAKEPEYLFTVRGVGYRFRDTGD